MFMYASEMYQEKQYDMWSELEKVFKVRWMQLVLLFPVDVN